MKIRTKICLVLFFVLSSFSWRSSGEISKYCASWKKNDGNMKLPECHGADQWAPFAAACARGPNFCMCNESDDNPIRGKKAKEYCEFLLADNWDSWKYPYRGRDQNNARFTASSPDRLKEELQKEYDGVCVSSLMCLAFGPAATNHHPSAMFRTAPFYPWRKMSKGWGGVDPELQTNRLLFTNAAIAQEGLSFCIVGRHLKRSQLSTSSSLKGFLSFLEKSFDIGNHIDPDDSTKMNHFILPEEHKAILVKLKPKAEFDGKYHEKFKTYLQEARLPRHEYENVIMGYRKHTGYDDGWPNPDVPMIDGFIKRPAHPDYQPHYSCRNPYFVKVTTILADGKHLHNYLHIKVYSDKIRDPDEKRCPTGKMKFLMLEVRDEHGYPVGQFTDDIPCEKDDETLEVQRSKNGEEGVVMKAYTATKDNVVPCMYTHPKATVHPTILLVSAVNSDSTGNAGDGGFLPGEQGPGGSAGSDPGEGSGSSSSDSADFCRNSSTHPKDRKPVNFVYKTNNDNYFTEVHATWRYSQMNNGWVKELHFATMIIEDEKPIQYYTSRRTSWTGPDTKYHVPCHAFGTIKQELLKPISLRTKFDCNENDTSDYDPQHGCFFWKPANQYWSHVVVYQLGLLNRCAAPNDTTNRRYGYSAQYSVLYPTQMTLGGWDYFQKEFVPPEDVNCHVDITPGELYNFNLGEYGHIPMRSSLSDYLDHTYRLVETKRYKEDKFEAYERPHHDHCYRTGHFDQSLRLTVYELSDWHTPGHSKSTDSNPFMHYLQFHYFGFAPEVPMKKMFRSAHQDPVLLKTEFPDDPPREYFGSEYLLSPEPEKEPANLQGPIPDELDQKFSMEEMSQKSRCPCPYIITTPPPELQTKTAQEIQGRKLHVINTLFAWMVLVPLAFFVARFYKETFTKVFFFQEFWWYTIHALALWTALLFTGGGIYALHVKRGGNYEIVWTDATSVHVYTSYVLLGVYIIHLISGPFRVYDTEWRMIQIALHWGIGCLEYCLAIVVILSATAIPSGIMNCTAFGVYCGFIVFQVGMTLGMELYMRKVVDRELNLDPPREYMPPPMMRIFHRDAPHSKCRIVMLIIFALGCCTFYAMMHLFLALDGGETGCFQPQAEKPKSQSIV